MQKVMFSFISALLLAVAGLIPVTLPADDGTAAKIEKEPGFWKSVGDFFLPHMDSRKILVEKQTQYFLVTVEEDFQGWRHLVFNPNKGSQGIWNPAAPNEIVSRYCRLSTLFTTALEHPPRRALFIGLGAGIVPRYVREIYPDIQIDLVEVDPAIPEIATGYFNFKTDARMKVIIADGRDFINRCREKYDLILIDAYTAECIPFQLTTVEFFRKIREAMSPGGLMIANIADLGKENFIAAEIKTAREVFPELAVFVCGDNTNFMLMGRQGGNINSEKMSAKAAGIDRRNHPELDFDEMIESRMSQEEIIEMIEDGMILKDDFAPVETLR